MFRVINIKTTTDFYTVKVPGSSFEEAVNRLMPVMTDCSDRNTELLFVDLINGRSVQKIALRWNMIESFRDAGIYEVH